jgi:hypothetical protein
MPAAGEGPTLEQRLNGYFGGKIIAFSQPSGGEQTQRRVVVSVKGDRDPVRVLCCCCCCCCLVDVVFVLCLGIWKFFAHVE